MNYIFTNVFKETLEKKFTSYLLKTAKGIATDFKKNEAQVRHHEYLVDNDTINIIGVVSSEENFDFLFNDFDNFNNCELEYAFKKLSSKQKLVLILVFIEDKTEFEIAKLMNISQQRINSIKHKALSLIRNEMGCYK